MQKRFWNSAWKRPLSLGMVFVLALGTYLLWSYLPPWVRAYAWPCGGTPWPVWFGLLALFAGLTLRGRIRWLVLLSFAFLSLNQRAAAVECTRRWDCANNECCHGGECLPKSDPHCSPPPPPDQPPVIAGALACEAWGAGGWCTGNETLELSASEPQGQQLLISGEVAGTPFACPPADGAASCAVPLPEGAGTTSYTATSATGLTASGATDWLRDSSAPVIDGTLSGTAGTGGWFMSSVQVSVSASDPLSGLAGLEYNLDGGVYEPYTAALTLTDGVHMLNFRALDMAGNQDELSQIVSVDTLPPEIDMPAAWKLGRTVDFEVQDLQSGIANVRVVVADEQERFPKVSWNEDITGATFNGEIDWDGRWKDGSLAIPGEYFAWVKATDQAGNEGRRYGLVKVPEPVYVYSAPLPVTPVPTATDIPTLEPLVLDAPSVPEVVSASEVTTSPRTTIVAFGTSGKSAAKPGASNSNILWGAAAVAAVGAFAAEVARRKQAKPRQSAEARGSSDYRAKIRAGKMAKLEAEWAAERAQAEAAQQAAQDARLTRKEAELEPELPPARPETSYAPPDMSWKQGDYAQLEHAREVAEANNPKSWGEKAFDWVDAHQTEIAIGVGIGVGVAAVILTGGTAIPFLLAAGGAMLAAGGVIAAETVIVNAHYGRSLGENLLKNVAIASGTALVVTSVGLALTGGVANGAIQQVLYRGGNAITGYCSHHPVACGRAVVGLELWDKLEDLGLQAKLFLQTSRGDPGAANTALELELERLDNMPGNTTFREALDNAVSLLKKKSDETAQILKTFSRLGVNVDMQNDGLIKIGAGAAPDAIMDAVDELRLIPGRSVWFSGGTIYINIPTEDSLKAVAKLQTAVESGADDATKTRLIEGIVDATTHGSGDRVVLGAWKEKSGYILEAIGNDGIFFETSDEVWEWIEDTGTDPWLINEQFLKNQLESGVERIDFVGEDILDVLSTVPDKSYRVREIKWLLEHADDYGYELIGNSWVNTHP